MSDLMLHGVLNMPPECWSGDELDKFQRHSRYVQASKRITDLNKALELLTRISDWPAHLSDEDEQLIRGLLREAELA